MHSHPAMLEVCILYSWLHCSYALRFSCASLQNYILVERSTACTIAQLTQRFVFYLVCNMSLCSHDTVPIWNYSCTIERNKTPRATNNFQMGYQLFHILENVHNTLETSFYTGFTPFDQGKIPELFQVFSRYIEHFLDLGRRGKSRYIP